MFMIRMPSVAKPRTMSSETLRSCFSVGGATEERGELFVDASAGGVGSESGGFAIVI